MVLSPRGSYATAGVLYLVHSRKLYARVGSGEHSEDAVMARKSQAKIVVGARKGRQAFVDPSGGRQALMPSDFSPGTIIVAGCENIRVVRGENASYFELSHRQYGRLLPRHFLPGTVLLCPKKSCSWLKSQQG